MDVSRIDAVVLLMLHRPAGRIRFSYARVPWDGVVYGGNARLAVVMLADSAHIQEKDAEFLARHRKDAVTPLYSMVDATRAADSGRRSIPQDL